MADEDDELPQEETPEPRLFTLTEAERTRRELEPVLIEAMDCRRSCLGWTRSWRRWRREL